MSDPVSLNWTPDRIRRVAREIAGVEFTAAEVEALLPMVEMLFADAAAAQAFNRDGLEPRVRFVVEEWEP
jgi:hypothetical protein